MRNHIKAWRPALRAYGLAVLALLAAAPGATTVLAAQAAPDCSASMTLADFGENSTGYIDIAPGESCQFPIRMRGMASGSEISQKPGYGKLKKINPTSYEYRAKAKYTGNDTFAIKVTGQGSTKSGTSVITVNVTIK